MRIAAAGEGRCEPGRVVVEKETVEGAGTRNRCQWQQGDDVPREVVVDGWDARFHAMPYHSDQAAPEDPTLRISKVYSRGTLSWKPVGASHEP